MFALIQMNTRRDVLKLYKELLKLSKEWTGKDLSKTEIERIRIREEIQQGFRKNKNVDDENKVRTLIQYAEDRRDIATHYGIPFERQHYLVQGTKIKKKKAPKIVIEKK